MRTNCVLKSSLSCLTLAASFMACSTSYAAPGTPWQMHDGLEVTQDNPYGLVQFTCTPVVNGDACEYDNATIPPADDPGWVAAPNTDNIGFGIDSRVCNAPTTCLAYGDFTYFQTSVDIPADTVPTEFKIVISGVDDGTRVSIFNSAYPTGLIIPNSYITYGQGGSGTVDLLSYAVAGEANRIVVTQVDDCCSWNSLSSAEVILTVPPQPPATPINATGIILTRNWETDNDQAQFKLKNVAGIKDAAEKAIADGLPLTFQFGATCDNPIYSFERSDFTSTYLNLRLTDGNLDVVRCLYSSEECVVNIKNTDLDDDALNSLLSGDMTLCLGVGDTNYTNSGTWTQYDSGSGSWTKYRKDL